MSSKIDTMIAEVLEERRRLLEATLNDPRVERLMLKYAVQAAESGGVLDITGFDAEMRPLVQAVLGTNIAQSAKEVS